MSLRLDRAVAFNAKRLAAGELRAEDIAYLVEFFQAHRSLPRDGMAGMDETLPELARYIRSLAPVVADEFHPMASGYWPLPILVTPLRPDGVKPEVSCEFGAGRDFDAHGKPTRGHGGCDLMYRRLARGAQKKPDYLRDWYCPQDPEVPILACFPGEVVIAGHGKARNEQDVIEIVVDHGVIKGFGRLAIESLHCKRLLVKRGAMVDGGQPIAIVGNTATDTTHDHTEVWTANSNGRPLRAEKVNPSPLFAQMKYVTYTPGGEAFDPAHLVL